MKNIYLFLFIIVLFAILIACTTTDVVESGKYQGTIKKVEADKTEIYVETIDGKTLELYFTDQTLVFQNSDTLQFSALQEGQNVEVDLKKVGKRLDPITVTIKE